MSLLILPASVLALFMSVLFIVATIRKNNGTADIGYGIAFIILTGTTLTQVYPSSWYVYLLVFLVCIWGIRLALRIYVKNANKPEDFRYHAWRESWGDTFLIRSFLQIYTLQGSIIFLVALPVTLSIIAPTLTAVPLYFYIGSIIWILGFFFEAASDYELDTFIKNPLNKGKIMTIGLWRYSRHPNYFGESLMWWGLGLAGFSITNSLFVFISPVLITFLLLKVSGIPMLERRFVGNPEWESYKTRTSPFIPLPPKK